MRLPDYLLTHEVQVEPYLGTAGHGPSYGPPVTWPAFVDATHKVVRTSAGEEVTATATVYLQADAAVGDEDRVTVAGRPARVVSIARRDGRGLPTPDHLEVAVQ